MSTAHSRRQKPRTWLVLLLLVGVAAALTAWNSWKTAREIGLATGPPTPEQERYFVEVHDRPDLMAFFKSLTKQQKLAWAKNLGEHDDPQVVRLTAKLLESFDEDIRKELTASMAKLAKKQPEVVSKQMAYPGSFQRNGIFAAMRSLGRAALPHIAARLREGDTRSSAVTYLVEEGAISIPLLIEALNDEATDTRLAAADALARLRAKAAVPGITALHAKAEGDERLGYMSALAAIGDSSSESLLAQTLDDTSLQPATRAEAALGLGRVGTPSAAKKLWAYVNHDERDLATGAMAALQLAGDAALVDTSQPIALRLQVAKEVRTGAANKLLDEALVHPNKAIRLAAAKALGERPQLVWSAVRALSAADEESEGDIIAALVRSLASTDEGRQALASFPKDSVVGAFVQRNGLLTGGH
jgi:HEAT repeat protein